MSDIERYGSLDTSVFLTYDAKQFELKTSGATDFIKVYKQNDSVFADQLARSGVQFSVNPGNLSIIEYTASWGAPENRILLGIYNTQPRPGAKTLQGVKIIRTKNDGTIKTIHQLSLPDKILIAKAADEVPGEKGAEKVWKFFCENLTWEDTEPVPEG